MGRLPNLTPVAMVMVLALAFTGTASRAETGLVLRVIDGDTLVVRPTEPGQPRHLRLDGIDAPEICQAHGAAARDALRRRTRGQTVEYRVLRRDEYGRAIARVWLGDEDLGAWMVSEGHAWSYRFRQGQGPYRRQEQGARTARRGLFADPETPEPPHEFRRRHGPCG